MARSRTSGQTRPAGAAGVAPELGPAWLAAIVDSSFDAIISKTVDGTITSWNAAAERMYGYTAAEAIGSSIEIIVPQERRGELRWIDQRLARGERLPPFETLRVTRDGRLIDVALTISPICDAQGRVHGSSGIGRDITERRRAEERLQLSERELADFVENSVVALHWVDPDGTVLWANRAELDLLGFSREEVIGRHVSTFHADQPVIEDILTRLRRNEELTNYEARLRCKDGAIRHVLISSNVYREDGRFIHTRCFTNDITERKRAEILLAGQKRALELIARDVPLESVLEVLVRTFEERSIYGALGSVLLLDRDGRHLRHGAAPSLPEDYNRAIDGVAVGPGVGSCGTAAHSRKPAIATDIGSDPTWRDYRDLALRHGLRACWSVPILARGDQVLGTYAIYYREPRAPSAEDLQVIGVLSRTAAIAIEAKRAAEALRESERHLRRLLDGLGAMVAVTSPDGLVIEVNRTALELGSLQAEEVLGTPIEETYWWSYAPEVKRRLRRAVRRAARGEPARYDVLLRVGPERYKAFDFMLTPLLDGSGRVTHLIPSAIDITARRRAERQRQLLIEELNHRVKNTLATAQSLANQTLRTSSAPSHFVAAFNSRLAALASAHTLLADARWTGAALHALIAQQLAPHRTPERANIVVQGEDAWLPPSAALTLGLALHELTTNAAKHGALAHGGAIEIRSELRGGPDGQLIVALCWSERAGRPVSEPERRGFGVTMIERGLAYQLGGSAKLEFRREGLRCEIEFPLAKAAADAASDWLGERELDGVG